MRLHGPQILQPPSRKIIYDNHGFAVGQQPIHQVRPDEPGATGYEDVMHET
jgi:hypothetical protein